MGWLDFNSKSKKEKDDARSSFTWGDNLNATDWQHYTDPRTLIPTILLTTTMLVSARLYRSYLRRIPEAAYIRPRFFRKRSLFGTVTRVGDADNFHLFHTPGGRLAGWGWFPGRKTLPEGKDLKNKTVCTPQCTVGILSFYAKSNIYRSTFESLESMHRKEHILANLPNHSQQKL